MKLTKIAIAAVMTASLAAAGVGVAAAVAQASTTGSTTGTTASACRPPTTTGAWPAWADGQPGRSPGVTVWHDRTGWHVRVTHDSLHDRVFSGEIATTGELVGVRGYRLEKNDKLVVGPDKHVLEFRFNNYGHVDGFDFATACAPSLEFGFLTDAHRVPVSRIAVGAGAHHPARDPFVIKRSV